MATCQARITYPHLKQHFGDGYHVFYLETFCGNPIPSGTHCKLCQTKSDTRVQFSRRFDHGLVSGELPPHSHIFGSEWYEKKTATYGTPSQAVVELAMEAQRRARSGNRAPPVAAKPKLVVRRKAATPSSTASSSDSSVVDQLHSSIIKRTPSQESMAESMDDPIEVQTVVRMKLKATIVEGREVWLETATGNVYERVAGQPRGPLMGTWDGFTFTESCV